MCFSSYYIYVLFLGLTKSQYSKPEVQSSVFYDPALRGRAE